MTVVDVLSTRVVAYNPILTKLGIGATGAIFLSQALYWSKTKGEEGWFYKTQEEWKDETGLTKYELQTARKKIKEIGVLEEKRDGFKPIIWYRVKTKTLNLLISSVIQSDKKETDVEENHSDITSSDMAGIQPQLRLQSSHSCGYNPAVVYKEHRLHTEITNRYKTNVENLSDEQIVFNHWKDVCGHEKAKLDAKRKRRIKDRLREGFSIEDLKLAITGCTKSAFHMGHNPAGRRYDDIELIARDASKVEMFISFANKLQIPKTMGDLYGERELASWLMTDASIKSKS